MVRDLPAVEGCGRDQHGEVGLAAGAGEGGGHIGFFALRRFDAHDQHVLGQPVVIVGDQRGDAQGKALLAEQGVAAVATAKGPDGALFGEVHDVLLLLVAGPGHVRLAGRQRHAHRMHAGHELAVAEHVEHLAAHAGHDAHVDGHVGRVGELDADMGDGRAERPHAEGDHVHGAAAHAAVEEIVQGLAHLLRVHPVVGRPGILLGATADEGAIFDAGDVAGIGAGQEAARALLGIEPDEGAALRPSGRTASRTPPASRHTSARYPACRALPFLRTQAQQAPVTSRIPGISMRFSSVYPHQTWQTKGHASGRKPKCATSSLK